VSNPVNGVVPRAARAVRELLACYQQARTTNEREQVAKLIACLTPSGALSLAEMADQALAVAKDEG
jgi:hypothetical protein